MGGCSLCSGLSVSLFTFCFYPLVVTINAALVADIVAVQCLAICAFFHILAMTWAQMSAKGEAEVVVTFNPFPAVLDLSTSKAQILRSRAEQSRAELHPGNWIHLVQRE